MSDDESIPSTPLGAEESPPMQPARPVDVIIVDDDSGEEHAEAAPPPQINPVNNLIDEALREALRMLKKKNTELKKLSITAIAARSFIHKAGYAEGSGKAAKAAQRKAQKGNMAQGNPSMKLKQHRQVSRRVVPPGSDEPVERKEVKGKRDDELVEEDAGLEGPFKVVTLSSRNQVAYEQLLRQVNGFVKVAVGGALPSCRFVARQATHLGHTRRRHTVRLSESVQIQESETGSRYFMTHVVIATQGCNGKAWDRDKDGKIYLRPIQPGDHASHLCHDHGCVNPLHLTIEGPGLNALREKCHKSGACKCELAIECIFA